MTQASAEITAYTPEGLLLEGPFPSGDGQRVVRVTDPLTGETVSKKFAHDGRARRFIADAILGQTNRQSTAPLDGHDQWRDYAPEPLIDARSRPRFHRDGREMTPEERAASPRINIRPVKDVLEDFGLDPTFELAKSLYAQEPVKENGRIVYEKDADGLDIVDPLTGELQPKMKYVLSESQRTAVMVELQQYITPKLKAVEVKAEVKTPMSEEQLDARIARLAAKHPELAAIVALAKAA